MAIENFEARVRSVYVTFRDDMNLTAAELDDMIEQWATRSHTASRILVEAARRLRAERSVG